MSEPIAPRTAVSRRRLLRLGGAASRRRGGRPSCAVRRRRSGGAAPAVRTAAPSPRRRPCTWSAPTAGSRCRPAPAGPAVLPRLAGAEPDNLRLRVPRRHRHDRNWPARSSVRPRADLRADPGVRRGGRDLPDAAPTSGSACARTSTTATRCTGTASSTPSRSSTASRSCRWPCRSAATSPTSTSRTTPGTYMYHCHFEDVEHVQMGMTGMVFVRPKQNNATAAHPAGTASTPTTTATAATALRPRVRASCSPSCGRPHYRDAHIQVSDWTDYDAELLAA